MSEPWPGLVLIDRDEGVRAQLAIAARKLRIGFRAVGAIPDDRDSKRIGVRVAVCAVGGSRALISRVRAAFPAARVIVCTHDDSQQAAVEAFRAGADDFVAAQGGSSELQRLLAMHFTPSADHEREGLIGESDALRALRDYALRLAPSNVSVLVSGETGTGKECLAALVHRHSRRTAGPLVALNCAAIPDGLLEGELFGYERGAFSGAHSQYPGKLKLADGGTLLLDEIGELSLAGQAKVLRAVETGEAYRLGASRPTRFDVRIIAATNRDLCAEVAAGRFREDLFYRLAVARLEVPPLRERRDDIAAIARYLLAQLIEASRLPPLGIDHAAMRLLESYAWPGNVRELRNVIEIATVTCRGGLIQPGDLPCYIHKVPATTPREDERTRLTRTLALASGNKSEAAKALGLSRMTLYRRLAKHGLAESELSLV